MGATLDSINTTAAALKTIINGLSVQFTADGQTHTVAVKGYRWQPPDLDLLPAAVIELPSIDRGELDEGESELGARDLTLEFAVEFICDMTSAPEYVQAQALAIVCDFIDAVDVDGLDADAGVWDVKVTRAERPDLAEDRSTKKPLLIYPATVQVFKKVT
jgi:hypothetical protein